MKASVRHALEVVGYVALSTVISVGMTLFLKWFLHRHQSTKQPVPVLPRSVYWKLAVPIGICSSLDVMFSNLSFLYITVTFYTIVKSCGNVWTLLFSVWLGHQRASWPLAFVVVLICSGIALSSYGSTVFEIRGFLLVLGASMAGTLRWVLTQSLLKVLGEEINSSARTKTLTIIHLTSPASALGLLPFTLAMDGKALMQSKFTTQPDLLSLSMLFTLAGACLGFAMLMVRILLVEKTSALTLGVSGSVRDITQISLAVVLFGDTLSVVNIVGLGVGTTGILLYSLLREKKNKDEKEDHRATDEPYMLSENTPGANRSAEQHC